MYDNFQKLAIILGVVNSIDMEYEMINLHPFRQIQAPNILTY